MAKYQLSRVVQSDDLYVHLKFDQSVTLTVNGNIPVFFRVQLEQFNSPMLFIVNYQPGNEQ